MAVPAERTLEALVRHELRGPIGQSSSRHCVAELWRELRRAAAVGSGIRVWLTFRIRRVVRRRSRNAKTLQKAGWKRLSSRGRSGMASHFPAAPIPRRRLRPAVPESVGSARGVTTPHGKPSTPQ